MSVEPTVSIIMVAYDANQTMRNVTLQAIESIIKYTDEKDYEIVFMDLVPTGAESLRWWDGYHILQMGERDDRRWYKEFEKDTGDPGQYAMYNQGVKHAKGKHLCFFQNDVFVGEGWLKDMLYYLDNDLADCVLPDQYPRTREEILRFYDMPHEDANVGRRDAGLVLMSRDAYERVGGWNEAIKMNYGEKDFYERIDRAGVRQVVTVKTPILHLKHATGWLKGVNQEEKYNEENSLSSTIVQMPFDERTGHAPH